MPRRELIEMASIISFFGKAIASVAAIVICSSSIVILLVYSDDITRVEYNGEFGSIIVWASILGLFGVISSNSGKLLICIFNFQYKSIIIDYVLSIFIFNTSYLIIDMDNYIRQVPSLLFSIYIFIVLFVRDILIAIGKLMLRYIG